MNNPAYYKKTVIFICFGLFLFTNCSKQNNNDSTGYWSVGNQIDQRYSINYTSRQDSLGYSILTGSDNLTSAAHPHVNRIYLWFSKSFPAENGEYEMVNVHYRPFALSDNQLGISGIFSNAPPISIPCSASDSAFFDATGVSSMFTWPWTLSGKAELTIDNGKIRVTIPQTYAQYYNQCAIDSPYLRVVFQEK